MTRDTSIDMRRFLRHPSDMPISVIAEGLPGLLSPRLKDLSGGGLSFFSDHDIPTGTVIRVSIACVQPAFESDGCVVWCKKEGDSFQVGIEFMNAEEAFHARMVEQVCHIEHYRKEVMSCEGRHLTIEEAAEEWVAKYASKFP